MFTGMYHAFRTDLLDQRSGWFQRNASGEIVVVAIDARSIQKIGVWPWPRTMHAELVRTLAAAGAREIAFDVDFSSRSNETSDRSFAEAVRNAGGGVILPAFKQRIREGLNDRIHVSRPIEALNDAG